MKITKNFSKREFDSKDGARMPDDVYDNIIGVAINLQVLRDTLNAPIIINSGYRSPQHNKEVGGVPNSQHVKGMAADIKSSHYTSKEISEVIEKLIAEGSMEEGGIGIYNTFVHYDTRGYKARWDNR